MSKMKGRANDRLGTLGGRYGMSESGLWRPVWTITKYADEDAHRRSEHYERLVLPGNKLLNEGINELFNLLCGDVGATPFDNANAYIGVGNGGLTAITGVSVAFTTGSRAVVGVGTGFGGVGAGDPVVGDWIQLDADGVLYLVDHVTNVTNLELYYAYGETGAAPGAGSLLKPADTDLLGGSTQYNAMDGGFPTYGATQLATWQATFAAGEANFAWAEITVCNGATGASVNLNRLVQSMGTKVAPAVWTASLEVSLV